MIKLKKKKNMIEVTIGHFPCIQIQEHIMELDFTCGTMQLDIMNINEKKA